MDNQFTVGKVFLICMLVSVILGVAEEIYSETTMQETVLQRVSEGYEIYIDGIEVEPENVDVSMYEVSIDDEQQKIFMTHKTKTKTKWWPYFICTS